MYSLKKIVLSLFALGIFLSFSNNLAVAAPDPLAGIACIPGKTMAENKGKCDVSLVGDFAKKLIRGSLQIFFIVLTVILAGSLLLDFWKTGASSGSTQFILNSKKKFGGVVLGVLGLLFMFGGSIDMLRDFGFPEEYLKYASYLLSLLPVQHTYAAETIKPLISGSITDIILNGVKVIWTWIVFPVMIAGWFFSGFKYVAAQGNPEKIKEAHGVLTAIVLVTVFVLFVQGFLSSVF